VPRLLIRLAGNKLSGKLKVTAGDIYKIIYLERGDIAAVVSDLVEESLARYLIEHSDLDLLEIEEAAEIRKDDTVALHFFKERKISREQLLRCMVSAYSDRLAGIMGVGSGRYEFYKDVSPPVGILERPLPAFRLFTAAIRRSMTYEDTIGVIGKYLDRRPAKVDNERISLDDAALTPRELDVLGSIPLDETLRNIFETGQDIEKRNIIARVVYLLYQYELIKFR